MMDMAMDDVSFYHPGDRSYEEEEKVWDLEMDLDNWNNKLLTCPPNSQWPGSHGEPDLGSTFGTTETPVSPAVTFARLDAVTLAPEPAMSLELENEDLPDLPESQDLGDEEFRKAFQELSSVGALTDSQLDEIAASSGNSVDQELYTVDILERKKECLRTLETVGEDLRRKISAYPAGTNVNISGTLLLEVGVPSLEVSEPRPENPEGERQGGSEGGETPPRPLPPPPPHPPPPQPRRKQGRKRIRGKDHGDGKYYCEHCDKSYASNSNLSRHRSNKHKDKIPVKCPICKKPQGRNDYLKPHLIKMHGLRGVALRNALPKPSGVKKR